jgi:hypothetical protein
VRVVPRCSASLLVCVALTHSSFLKSKKKNNRVRFLQTDQSPYEILDGSAYLFLLAPVNWKIEGIVINTFVLLLAISVPAFQCYLLSLLLMRVKDISTETDASKDPRNLAFAIIFLALKVIAHIFQGLELMAMTFYYDPKSRGFLEAPAFFHWIN